ncbi:MBL fold metallo-hydrolase [Candidatus Methylospira mobilis]|uniref:MBL fold metallo-hydrolase n=1 Tax=Candidatus Methylospira mobilis TaxID=1808979 RepID=UPI0028E74D65|nr:MBL fold metallo-hydrolase [Candidatus Methylospira mobilis]WNV06645.1 MBL fold metallo-hydrolase [Candidatus Methylospira mobilis]
MIFRQLFDAETSTYSYLLGCERKRSALLIDPVASEVAAYIELLAELDLELLYTLETHVHADHITGAALLREITGSKSVVHRDGGARCADLLVTHDERLQVGTVDIRVLHTPGHTGGCVSYLIGDRVFTGDALLIDGCGRTDFQQGDAGTLYDSIHRHLFTLPPETLVYPGHDYHNKSMSTIGQEIAGNARLGAARSRQDFIALMDELNLPYPRLIDQALPANQDCGKLPQSYQGAASP